MRPGITFKWVVGNVCRLAFYPPHANLCFKFVYFLSASSFKDLSMGERDSSRIFKDKFVGKIDSSFCTSIPGMRHRQERNPGGPSTIKFKVVMLQ